MAVHSPAGPSLVRGMLGSSFVVGGSGTAGRGQAAAGTDGPCERGAVAGPER